MIGLDRCAGWFTPQHSTHHPHNPNIVGDCLRLPFKDAFFDVILCCDVLHHLSTARRRIDALKELSRCLRIGGKVLITVRSPNADLRMLESQDLLIRVNQCTVLEHEHDSDDSDSFTDSDSDLDDPHIRYGKASLSTNASSTRINTNYTSPSSADLENCYTFVKRAIKRLSMARALYQKSDHNPPQPTVNVASVQSERNEPLFAIELRNLDPEAHVLMRNSDSTGSSLMESLASSSGPTTSSSGFFSASFLSNIREHFVSWRTQLVNNSVWHSLDTKLGSLNDAQHDSEPFSHRFSLPLNFLKPEPPPKHILTTRNRVHDYSAQPTIVQYFGEKSFKLDLPESVSSRLSFRTENIDPISSTFITNSHITHVPPRRPSQGASWRRHHHRPSIARVMLTSTVSRSLPDLVAISRELCGDSLGAHSGTRRLSMPSLTEHLHRRKLSWFDECFHGSIAEETTISLDHRSPTPNSCLTELDENLTSLRSIVPPNARKLSRQRSFSADYQSVEIPPCETTPRRFSASPNIGTHRYNNNCHTPHIQQISVDSEESFITIIPAIRSARVSITDANTCDNLTDFDEEEENVLSDNDVDDLFSSSDENDDDAYCESLSCTSIDNTSFSSGLEPTVKSLITKSPTQHSQHSQATTDQDNSSFDDDSNSSSDDTDEEESDVKQRDLFEDNHTPPSILHRYYHLFRDDELEETIREHIADLDLIESFFEPESSSWCIVAEKIRVWTI